MFNSQHRKRQQGFHLIEVLVVLAVLGLIAFIGYRVYQATNNNTPPSSDNRGPNYKALSACGDQPVLTTLPTNLSELDFIAPLGGVDPPDHTLPTDHMYMMYPYGSTGQRKIYAPASVVATSISYGGEFESGEFQRADYAISVYPCLGLKLIFGHMDVPGDKLSAAIGSDFDNNVGCNTSQQEYKEIKNCEKAIDVKISAGELLATSDGWDLWATQEGSRSVQVISPDYYHNVDAVCPLDYFTDDLKKQLYAKVKRDGQPKCGQAYQDKADTLQGGWFAHQDPMKAKTDWSSHFSLTHNSLENGIGQVAVSGKIADQFMYRFTPRHDGTINREPGETTAGAVYCYQHEGDKRFPNGRMAGDGKILLKLLDNHRMQIEHQAGACTANESFLKPTSYYR